MKKYFSLFSGIGGFEYGIASANLDWECCGYSEINPPSLKVYREHFPDHINFGNISLLIPELLPKFEILLGGFPCQSYSISGKRHGLNDPRGRLFWDIMRLVNSREPKAIFLENVKGLVDHDNGRSIDKITKTISKSGYNVFYKVLNSMCFGVPQHRTRVYIVAFQKKLGVNSFSFPDEVQDLNLSFYNFLEPNPPANVFLNLKDFRKLGGIGTKNKFAGEIKSGNIYSCITASYGKTNGNSMKFFRGDRLSCLSPIECERLQGFPDDWTKCISERNRYKALGNAVTTNVIAEIVKKIDPLA